MTREKLYLLIGLSVIVLVFVGLLNADSHAPLIFLPISVTEGTPDQSPPCWRAYSDDSPWNMLISDTGLNYHEDSDIFISTLSEAQDDSFLGSNPDKYTYPVYEVTDETPLITVTFSGIFSNVIDDGKKLERISGGGTVQVPIPDNASPSDGSDAQIIIVNTDSGDEWAFWVAERDDDGNWSARNGYHYNIKWDAVMPDGFASRGAGVSYLSGLIRKCEIENDFLNHAIAFAYDYPCSSSTCNSNGYPYYVWPASKSDGKGEERGDLPEGARLHISPPPTDSEMQQWCGSDTTCEIIVDALEKYGMFVIDNSGHAKMYPEFNGTANWGDMLTNNTVRDIPLSRFKVLEFSTDR
jgi:hypothetical protein